MQAAAVGLWREAAEACPFDSAWAYSHLFPPAYVWGMLAQAQAQAGCAVEEVLESSKVAEETTKVTVVLRVVEGVIACL